VREFVVTNAMGDGASTAAEVAKNSEVLNPKRRQFARSDDDAVVDKAKSAFQKDAFSIDFEALCVDLLPVVRDAIGRVWQHDHFADFSKNFKPNSLISESDVSALAAMRRMDPEVVQMVSTEFPLSSSVASESSPGQRIESKSTARWSADTATTAGPGVSGFQRPLATHETIGLEDVLRLMSRMQELTARRLRARERAVQAQFGVPEHCFWKFRGDLLHIGQIFESHDKDKDGSLEFPSTMRMLKQLGMQPYCPKQAAMIKNIWRKSDKDHNNKLRFCEFLDLMDMTRRNQQSGRTESLRRNFDKYDKDSSGRLDKCELEMVLKDAGLSMKTPEELDLIQRIIEEFDADKSGDISFQEYVELFQRIVERLFSWESEIALLFAKSIGLDRAKVEEYRFSFDKLDEDSSGKLSRNEVWQLLKLSVSRTLAKQELEDLIKELDRDDDGEICFHEFLQMMEMISLGQRTGEGVFARGLVFRVTDVNPLQVDKLLRTYPVTSAYLASLSPLEKQELLCKYLGVTPESDLRRALPEVIPDAARLVEYVRKKAKYAKPPSDFKVAP